MTISRFLMTQSSVSGPSCAYVTYGADFNTYTSNVAKISVNQSSVATTVISDFVRLTGVPIGYASVDSSRNLYISNYSPSSNQISKITPDGNLTTNWVTGINIPGTILIDSSDTLYVINGIKPGDVGGSNTISKVTSEGVVTSKWATTTSNSLGEYGAIDSSGNLFIIRSEVTTAQKIAKVTAAGSVTESWSTVGNQPRGILVDSSDNLYVPNYTGSVYKITPDGTSTVWSGITGTTSVGGVIDKSTGNIYILADYDQTAPAETTLTKITPSGVATDNWATGIKVAPTAISIDSSGNIYILDYYGNIQKVDSSGTVTLWASFQGSTPSSERARQLILAF